jgi:ABC-2 type transport system permease protein
MTGLLAILKKEWKLYFVTPAAYVVLALFAFISGYFFVSMLAYFVAQGLGGNPFGPSNLDVNTQVIQPLFFDVGITLLFLLPMITMRLYAEEFRSGTIELLKTTPVRRMEVALGKFLAGFGLLLLLVLITFGYMLVIVHFGKPDTHALWAAFLGLILLGGVFLSLGLLISSFTRNQIVAGVITFSLFLLLWVADWVTAYSSSGIGQFFAYISITSHLQNFARGVITVKDVVYYASLIAAGLFVTARRMELAE